MKRGGRIDFAMYLRAFGLLVRHPSILVMPLLASVAAVVVGQISPVFTDALGGLGGSIFNIVVQLIYGFCFGIAVIQASNAWRGRRASFDEAWEEGRRKAGGIMLATFGFYFLLWAAGYIGGLIGIASLGVVLELIAAFFLIYTIPAAAIGGMPGSLAISASFRAVRESILGTAILAIVFVALWMFVPNLLLDRFAMALGATGYQLALAAVRAVLLAYLAFPFAKQYDDVAFSRFW